MTFLDKNHTLEPPKDHTFYGVTAEGAYLRAEYRRRFSNGDDIVVIYLNDTGREVARAMTTVYLPQPISAPAPVGRWYKFRNAFYMTLEGLQEMIRCLS